MTAVRDNGSTRNARRIGGWRVGAVLVFVAVVPLLGLGSVTWTTVQDARQVASSAAEAEVLAAQAVDLTRLDGAVFDEVVWTAIANVAGSIGAAPGLIESFLGLDPTVQLQAAYERTDAAVAVAGRADVSAELVAARAADLDMAGVLETYTRIADMVQSTLGTTLDDLSLSRMGAADTDELVSAVDALEIAVTTRSQVAEQFYGFCATLFELRGTPAQEIAGLIRSRQTYESGLAALEAASTDQPELRAGVDELAADPELRAFAGEIDALIANSMAAGVPEQAPVLSLESLSQHFDAFDTVYRGVSGSSATTLRLLEAAAAGVLAATDGAKSDAAQHIERSYLLVALMTLATLLAALMAGRFIVLPLRGLRRAARGLHDNDGLDSIAIVGPTEVRAAALAIRDAGAHLELVTRQTRALAAGDLDSPVLDEAAPGGLGLAVQDAVGTLRSALAQQDEFRRRLAHEAAHDGLTKLPNRNASMAQLTRSLARTTRSGSKLAVLFIDLDHFKDVNDLNGHHAGDTVLTTVAQRLVNTVREGDHVGRLGGDEFVVLAEPVHDVDEAVGLARRILDILAEPIELGAVRVTIGASIGIALADGAELTADELLRDADLAVYRAKAVGRGGVEICDEDLRNEVAVTADLSLAIRQAIDNDDLIVHYQPIIDTSTNELHAFEALVRWRRAGHDELIPPDKFIGFAERSSLIIDLDRWVLDAVSRQVAAWHAEGKFTEIPVAINVSRRHLAHDHFVQHVLQPMQTYGVDPLSIIIEVTESALLDDLASAAMKLQRLRDAGVLVSIDDFGTGYTSLAHLRSLPVDILKIDRSFTANAASDPHEASIVKLIIDTGHLLGATITAEGVETAHEADTLGGLGSDNLQGFYFARPQPPDQLTYGVDTSPERTAGSSGR